VALAYRSGSFVSAGGASGGNLSLTKPTGTASGDVVFLLAYYEPDSSVQSVSDGPWESVIIANTGAFVITAFIKTAGGSEPASYTISNDIAGNQWRSACGVAYSGGTGTGTLIDLSATAQGDSVLATGQTAPTITTTGADRMVVFPYGCFSTAGSSAMNGFCANGRGTFGEMIIADALKTAAGATGTSNPTGTGTQDYAAMHIAIISDTGGGGGVTLAGRVSLLGAGR
jgi:hypothetical protein